MQKSRKAQAPASDSSCLIQVHVVPRSSRVSIELVGKMHYKIKLTSPPLEGAANDQLVRILADRLSLPRRQIEIISGEHARVKRLRLLGIEPDSVSRLLAS